MILQLLSPIYQLPCTFQTAGHNYYLLLNQNLIKERNKKKRDVITMRDIERRDVRKETSSYTV